MNERMTDEEATAADKAITAAGWMSSKGVGAKIRADWLRARASEVEKEAVIKVLADAVLRNGWWVNGGNDWHSRRCPQSLPPAGAPCTCADDRLALRLVGRLS